MKKLNIRPFSTPLIIGAGIFSSLTGLLMLIGVEDPLKFAHEVAGVAFSVAIVLHISTNWRPFKRYFLSRGVLIIALAWMAGVTLVMTSSFFRHREPDRFIVETIEQASVSDVAVVAGLFEDELVSLLATHGISVSVNDLEMTVSELADKHNSDTDDLLSLIFQFALSQRTRSR